MNTPNKKVQNERKFIGRSKDYYLKDSEIERKQILEEILGTEPMTDQEVRWRYHTLLDQLIALDRHWCTKQVKNLSKRAEEETDLPKKLHLKESNEGTYNVLKCLDKSYTVKNHES